VQNNLYLEKHFQKVWYRLVKVLVEYRYPLISGSLNNALELFYEEATPKVISAISLILFPLRVSVKVTDPLRFAKEFLLESIDGLTPLKVPFRAKVFAWVNVESVVAVHSKKSPLKRGGYRSESRYPKSRFGAFCAWVILLNSMNITH